MTTKKNSLQKTGKTLLQESTSLSFDALFNEKEEDVDKKIKFEQNRKGKQVQLLAKINNIQMLLTKAQTNYRKSLVDPTMDSVELAIEMKALVEEEKIAMQVYTQLFPNAQMP